jgi:hypothetical protein
MKFSRIDFLYAASLLHKTKEAPTLTPTLSIYGREAFTLTSILSPQGRGRSRNGFFTGRGRQRKGFL